MARHEDTSQRQPDGRFARGNKGGPGNPFARQAAQLRRALLQFQTEDDVRAVAAKLYLLAMGGDVAAIKLYLAYAVGKPADPVDPDRLDLEEVRLLLESRAATAALDESAPEVPAAPPQPPDEPGAIRDALATRLSELFDQATIELPRQAGEGRGAKGRPRPPIVSSETLDALRAAVNKRDLTAAPAAPARPAPPRDPGRR
jgi:hypothetical protein